MIDADVATRFLLCSEFSETNFLESYKERSLNYSIESNSVFHNDVIKNFIGSLEKLSNIKPHGKLKMLDNFPYEPTIGDIMLNQ